MISIVGMAWCISLERTGSDSIDEVYMFENTVFPILLFIDWRCRSQADFYSRIDSHTRGNRPPPSIDAACIRKKWSVTDWMNTKEALDIFGNKEHFLLWNETASGAYFLHTVMTSSEKSKTLIELTRIYLKIE